MQRVGVDLGDRGYEVAIGSGTIDEAGEHLTPWCMRGRAIVVTDANVAEAWLGRLTTALAGVGIEIEPVFIAPGEASKSWESLRNVAERLLALEIGRDEVVFALGGGVVGDLAGLAASLVKRGCGFVPIPTSLLAQVDSSVGGKTAINSHHGKNLIGAFYQPNFVLIDPATLATLPERELRAGYAELVKYGLIGDAGFFASCERRRERLLGGDEAALSEAIAHCVSAKAAIVAADETDRTGERALLNFGHSFAHALEAESGMSGVLLHGEAVAIGMALSFRLSVRTGLCEAGDAERAIKHLAKAGLPTTLPERIDAQQLVTHMRQDKKAKGDGLALVLTRGIGRAFLAKGVKAGEVETFLQHETG